MRIYKEAGYIKGALFLGAAILITGLFINTQSKINDLRNESRDTVSLYAQIIAKSVTSADDNELDFIFREIILKVTFPIIQSDIDGNLSLIHI